MAHTIYMDLMADRRVLVTGVGSTGTLGHGIARAFAVEGAHLAVAGRSKGRIRAAASDIASAAPPAAASPAAAPRVAAIVCDPLDAASIRDGASRAADALGGLDVLVACVQTVCGPSALPDTSPDALALALRSSVESVSAWADAARPHLAASPSASIVVVVPAPVPPPSVPVGALLPAVSGAVSGLVRDLSARLAPDAVTVNAVCPLARTAQTDKWAATFDGTAGEVVSSIPLGRLGDIPSDIAPACIFLASESARYITGQTLHADGGATL